MLWQHQAVITQHEKRQRQFDKLVDEWKRKVVDLQTELDNAQKESRLNAAEAYKYKAQLDENREVIDAIRRENKNLSGLLYIVYNKMQRDRAAGCVIVFAKSRRLELGDNILQTL